MLLGVCTQVCPQHPASPACTNKATVMLIPQFSWPVVLSLQNCWISPVKLSHLLTVWRSVSHMFREKSAPVVYNYCFTGSAQHWLSCPCSVGRNDALYRTRHLRLPSTSPGAMFYSVFTKLPELQCVPHRKRENLPLTNSVPYLCWALN